MTSPVKHWIEYILLRALAGVAGILPYEAAINLGCAVADAAYALSPRIRERGRRRLKQVFGESKSDAELESIARTAWRHLVLNGVEALRIPRLTDDWIRERVDSSSVQRLREILARQQGKGVVIAIPHMGNWELAGVVARFAGLPITTIMRRQKNVLADAHLNQMRARAGLEVLPTDAGLFRLLIRRLEEGRCVAILPDLRAKGRSVRVRFLNSEAKLPAGMAFFARQAGVPIVPACMLREKKGRHRSVVFDPVYPDMTRGRDEDYQRMMQQVMRPIDEMVQRYPEQYFWFNKRWVLGEEN